MSEPVEDRRDEDSPMDYRITLDEIDSDNIDAFRAQVDQAAAQAMHDGGVAVLDFGDVTFMDSTGVQVLYQRLGDLRSKDAELRIINAAPVIQRLLAIVGLDDVLQA